MNIKNERDWVGSSPDSLKLFYFNLNIIWQFNLYHLKKKSSEKSIWLFDYSTGLDYD